MLRTSFAGDTSAGSVSFRRIGQAAETSVIRTLTSGRSIQIIAAGNTPAGSAPDRCAAEMTIDQALGALLRAGLVARQTGARPVSNCRSPARPHPQHPLLAGPGLRAGALTQERGQAESHRHGPEARNRSATCRSRSLQPSLPGHWTTKKIEGGSNCSAARCRTSPSQEQFQHVQFLDPRDRDKAVFGIEAIIRGELQQHAAGAQPPVRSNSSTSPVSRVLRGAAGRAL